MRRRIVFDSAEHQVDDDPALLDLMLEDMEASDPLYRPTNYWAPYCEAVVAEIRANGLRDFRRRESEALTTFGARDTAPQFTPPDWTAPDSQTWDIFLSVLRMLNGFWEQGYIVGPDETSVDDYHAMCERVADLGGVEAGMPPASGLSVSRCGNPFGIADGGRFSTFVALYYYNFARFVAQHEPFSDVDVVVEIGSGSGAQAEVLKRLYPHLTIVLLDLAPQLYVAERFLRKAMPDFAVPYRRTHHSGWDGTLVPGGVHALRPQAIETLDPDGRVLFWNAASFGEMEPEVVENYATHVSRFAESLFLMQFFHGKQLGTPGAGGVLRQSTMASYEAAFADYERVAEAEAVRANGVTVLREGTLPYLNTLWRRRAA